MRSGFASGSALRWEAGLVAVTVVGTHAARAGGEILRSSPTTYDSGTESPSIHAAAKRRATAPRGGLAAPGLIAQTFQTYQKCQKT